MAEESDLELRIVELENKLRELSSDPEPEDISAAEVAAYTKVARAISRACSRSCYFCSRGCSACIALTEEAESLIYVCSRGCSRGCGRGCGRSCSCIVAAATAEEGVQSAVACRGCSYCYAARACSRSCVYCMVALAACECDAGGGCMPGTAEPGPRGRRGVGRFANLGE